MLIEQTSIRNSGHCHAGGIRNTAPSQYSTQEETDMETAFPSLLEPPEMARQPGNVTVRGYLHTAVIGDAPGLNLESPKTWRDYPMVEYHSGYSETATSSFMSFQLARCSLLLPLYQVGSGVYNLAEMSISGTAWSGMFRHHISGQYHVKRSTI